jgi:hypothetical protein
MSLHWNALRPPHPAGSGRCAMIVAWGHGSGPRTSTPRCTIRTHYSVCAAACSRRSIRAASLAIDVTEILTRVGALSAKFQLPDGQSADVLANSIEGFPVRTPEDFLAFLWAQLPDPVTGQRRPGELPCAARLSVHRRGWQEPIRSLSLGARGGGSLSLP